MHELVKGKRYRIRTTLMRRTGREFVGLYLGNNEIGFAQFFVVGRRKRMEVKTECICEVEQVLDDTPCAAASAPVPSSRKADTWSSKELPRWP